MSRLCVSALFKAIFYSAVVYLTVAYYLYLTVFSKSFGIVVFLLLLEKLFFFHGCKVWAGNNMIFITLFFFKAVAIVIDRLGLVSKASMYISAD